MTHRPSERPPESVKFLRSTPHLKALPGLHAAALHCFPPNPKQPGIKNICASSPTGGPEGTQVESIRVVAQARTWHCAALAWHCAAQWPLSVGPASPPLQARLRHQPRLLSWSCTTAGDLRGTAGAQTRTTSNDQTSGREARVSQCRKRPQCVCRLSQPRSACVQPDAAHRLTTRLLPAQISCTRASNTRSPLLTLACRRVCNAALGRRRAGRQQARCVLKIGRRELTAWVVFAHRLEAAGAG